MTMDTVFTTVATVIIVFKIGLLFSMTETVYREVGVLIGVQRT